MIEELKSKISSFFARSKLVSNNTILARQKLVFKVVMGVIFIFVIGLGLYVQEKTENSPKEEKKVSRVEIDLADKGLDTERHWREHFEAQRAEDRKLIENAIKDIKNSQEEIENKTNIRLEEELRVTQDQLRLAKQELTSASLDLKRVASERSKEQKDYFEESAMEVEDFESEIVYDKPKSAKNYIPEGTFFTGNILGGISVSTALNTPDDNATPVTIMLTSRGNLHKKNKVDISKCRIMGSSYGDLSSERAIIRLEKMICEENGIYTTSNIVGHVFGDDGYNGVKGKVIATSSKHLKNALIGGMISGFSGSAKGSESMVFSPGGLVSTQKQGMKDMFAKGAMQGAGNAGDKLADYYLRQAEAMSPVLLISPGVKVEAQITKGFYFGEIGTHKRLKNEKR